jgi:hypothetical protein
MYEYFGRPEPSIVNVGWLGRPHSFPVAEPSPKLVTTITALAFNPVNLCRGSHVCEFCPTVVVWIEPGRRYNLRVLGNGEVRVTANGITYVAPTLIAHYITAHHYAPPQVFIDAMCV